MVKPLVFSLSACVVLLAFVARGGDDAVAKGVLRKLKPDDPCPALLAAARTNDIPVNGLDAPGSTNTSQPGDRATILVTLHEKAGKAQWLLCLERTQPDPAKPPKENPPFVVRADSRPITFESKPVPAKLRLLGPFAASEKSRPSKPADTHATFFLDEALLSLGFDRTAALLWQRNQRAGAEPSAGPKPLRLKNLTPDEERVFYAAVPALISYAGIVQNTDGLEGLLFKLVKKPSLWSIIRHRGVRANIIFGRKEFPPTVANPDDWKLPASASVYHFPWLMEVNDQPSLKITLVVTSPRPPLLICGGVMALLAEKVGDDETYMTMRILSARRPGK